MNYIEQLLAKIEDAEARQEFSGLLEKVPAAKEWIFDPETRTRNEAISQWAESEWDYEHNMSRLEYQQQQELASLQAQITGHKPGMELNELNDFLGKYIKDNGLMTKAQFDTEVKTREDAFNKELNTLGTLSTRVSYLNAKHQKEFGDVFDPDVFVTQATEKGYAQYGKEGLDRFYNEEFTAAKRAEKAAAELERIKAEAREEGKKEALKERGMGEGGNMPTLDGEPDMGHFERKMRGMNKPVDGTQTQVPAEIELGRGVGKYAAALADAKDRMVQ